MKPSLALLRINTLPFDTLDVLVIDEMGKQISGCGMDTNVIGRMWVHGSDEFARPSIASIAVLDLTDGSHGNAAGLGLADFTTQRLVEKVDFAAFYINCLTASTGGLQRGQVPMVAVLPFALPHLRADWPKLRSKPGLTVLFAVTGGGAFGTLQFVALHFTTALNMGVVGSVAPAFIVAASWKQISYNFLFFVAGLQAFGGGFGSGLGSKILK